LALDEEKYYELWKMCSSFLIDTGRRVEPGTVAILFPTLFLRDKCNEFSTSFSDLYPPLFSLLALLTGHPAVSPLQVSDYGEPTFFSTLQFTPF